MTRSAQPRAIRLAAALALAAAACARPAPEPRLRVGTSGDYPPFSVAGAGFDVDLARRLAADLGFEVELVAFRWPELETRVGAGDFDVVMSGVTWRPWRAVDGYMTRAVAVGGPCVVGRPEAGRVAVNRGGVLERFARAHFGAERVLAVDRNQELGALLARGAVAAVVTDSFELSHLGVDGLPHRCEPAVDRKVLWVAPTRAATLGPVLDDWLGRHEAVLQALRARWLGDAAPRTELDHLLDLLARRLALAPAIAAWKRARGLPIEDPAREERVVESAVAHARGAGLATEPVAALFQLQIQLGKRIQADAVVAEAPGPPLDLPTRLRPELERLGRRIVASAAVVAPTDAAALDAADWTPLRVWLESAERERLRAALLALRRGD